MIKIRFCYIVAIAFVLQISTVWSGEKTPSQIGSRTIALFDLKRHRPLVTELFYPINPGARIKDPSDSWLRSPQARNAPLSKQSQKIPLILFSHGDGGSRIDSSWFMESLAAQGFLVAAVDHYGNTWYLNLPEVALKRWERAKDISFVLRELLKDPELGKRIDSSRIGFAGFSLGGTTGIWLAGGKANLYQKPTQTSSPMTELALGCDQEMIDQIDYSPAKQSFKDPLIRAFFLMAPGYGPAFDEVGLKEVSVPVAIVAGEKDDVLPIEENARRFSKWIKKSQLLILSGNIGHFVFLNKATNEGKKALTPRLFTDAPSVKRNKVHREVFQFALKFFNQYFK